MRKVDIKELKGKSYQDGEMLLVKSQYRYYGESVPEEEEIEKGIFSKETYFTLEDEDGEELHTISCIQKWRRTVRQGDILVMELWEETGAGR